MKLVTSSLSSLLQYFLSAYLVQNHIAIGSLECMESHTELIGACITIIMQRVHHAFVSIKQRGILYMFTSHLSHNNYMFTSHWYHSILYILYSTLHTSNRPFHPVSNTPFHQEACITEIILHRKSRNQTSQKQQGSHHYINYIIQATVPPWTSITFSNQGFFHHNKKGSHPIRSWVPAFGKKDPTYRFLSRQFGRIPKPLLKPYC